MNKKALLCSLFLPLALLCLCNTTGVNPGITPAAATSVVNLKITDADSTGWVQDTNTDTFTVSTNGNFNLVLDGGDLEYTSRGLVQASVQNLVGPDSQTMKAFCMDFGTAKKASAMFDYKKSLLTGGLIIPSFDSTIAWAKPLPLIGGLTVYSWFDKFYIELQMTGFADQAGAQSTAASFLKLYSSKIK